MYHPVNGVKKGRDKKRRINRLWGFYQASRRKYHVRWHRDVNAAINMVMIFKSLHFRGCKPTPFLRSTKRGDAKLDVPHANGYRYARRDDGKKRLKRWWVEPEKK